MDKYFQTELGISTSFDTSQFSDIELVGTMMQYKDAHRSVWSAIGIGGSITAAPLISNDTVFVGAHDKNFYALSLDGKEKWRFQTNANIPFQAAVGPGMVYFGSFDNNVYAVNTETGKLSWKFTTQGRIDGAPAYYKGMVFVASCDHNLYAVDAHTGKEMWKFRTKGELITPLVYQDRLYFGYEDAIFYCSDLKGRELWRFPLSERITAWPAAAFEGLVYFGSWDNNLYAVNAATGRLTWKFTAGDTVYAPRIFHGKLYVGSRDFKAYCFEAKSGKLIWTFKCNAFAVDIVVEDNIAYIASWDNNVYAVTADKGQLLWKFKTNGFVTYLTVSAGRVYFGSWDCNLYCLDAKTGKAIWKFRSSMGSPSKIAPPETGLVRTAQLTLAVEEEKDKEDRYKQEFIQDETAFKSQYVVKSEYAVKSKYTKSGKVKSMSSGWED